MSDFRELREALADLSKFRSPIRDDYAALLCVIDRLGRAADEHTLRALLADLDAARAEIARLTTLRPMSELTFADGNVLFHPTADADDARPTAEVHDVSFLTCRERSEWFRGWTPILEATP